MNTLFKQDKFRQDKFAAHGLFYFLIVLVVLTRLLPHPMNVTPIGALGLFSGAYLLNRWSPLVPLAALLISDCWLGFYTPIIMLSVYASFALSAVLGRFMLVKKITVMRVACGAFGSATILFVLSNATVWATGLYYPLTLDGLVACFILAIPFYGNTIIGDLFYAMVLFGSYEAIKHWVYKAHQSPVA